MKSPVRTADRQTAQQGLQICLERARTMTQIFKATEGEPMCMRRAKALAAHLYSMSLFTRENELIVGCFASSAKCLPTYPELYWRWLEDAVEKVPGYAAMLTGDEKKELFQIHEYWRSMSIHGREQEYIPQNRLWRIGDMVCGGWTWQWEASTPNYEKILKLGLKGILAEITARLEEVESDISISADKRMRMIDELWAMKISTEAASHWGKHYAMMLSRNQDRVRDHNRVREIDRMIEVCKNVPAEPARNLHEALQCFIFIHFIVSYIDQPQVGNGIRFDKVFGPYLDKDLRDGVLTRSQAKELVEAVWVKLQEGGHIQPPQWMNNSGGGLEFPTITLGGTDEQGNDITNEMTYLALEVCGDLQTITPQVAVRIHDGTPSKLYKAIFRCIRTGCSQPALFNDSVVIPLLRELGSPENEARLYSINHCMQPVIPGKNIHCRSGHSTGLILPMCLTLALSQGKLDLQRSKRVGYPTDPVSAFRTYEDLWNAFCRQVEYISETIGMIGQIADSLMKDYLPRPFLSAILDGNIERGCDMRDWEHLGLRHYPVFGCDNAAYGLALMKKLVFEEGKLTLEEYIQALEHNFEGCYGHIHQMIVHAVSELKKDKDSVDSISCALMEKVQQECRKMTDIYGNPYVLESTAAFTPMSAWVGLPVPCDVRKVAEAFHEEAVPSSREPVFPGAGDAIQPAAEMSPIITGDLLLNQKSMSVFLDPPDDEVMEEYLKSLMDMQVHHIQFDCVDAGKLLKAKERPEDYKNLIVRVAGHCAFFVDLDSLVQDGIIRRAEQTSRDMPH
jgi:choline trimethylamine-lyase